MNIRASAFHYFLLICVALSIGLQSSVDAAELASGTTNNKSRLIVLTDIGNEPDDQMSMVRLMLYSNEIDIEGLIATTSTWLKTKTNPQTIREIIYDYGFVQPNLLLHAKGWPTAEELLNKVSVGQPAYGMAAVGSSKMSAGAQAIIDAADRQDSRPLWVSIWGGANTLAQALLHVKESRTSEQLQTFVAKLRVYSISDQDDAGAWIRREFPALFYIVTPTSQDGGEYAYATWTGISGDVYYRNGDGADGSTVTNEWLEKNIRNKGPLSKHYLKYAFIMEGDTPSFLGLTNNGLASATNPSWGGWGGRYILRKSNAEARPIWTQGGDEFGRITSRDTVMGSDGRPRVSDQATIWRWRNAFQNEFAARMDWTIQPHSKANHNPVAIVNTSSGNEPIYLSVKPGESIQLDASHSYDPDKNKLRYRWFHYNEAGFSGTEEMADISIKGANSTVATITSSTKCRPIWVLSNTPSDSPCVNGRAHVIFVVSDDGKPVLTNYRRIILSVKEPTLSPKTE